jgi:integrase
MSNTIVRAPRRHRFVIIDQRAIEDTRLSWEARGLLGYLLSRPDDWKVLVNDLRKRGDLGRDGIYRLLREEAMKFQPSFADRGDHLVLKSSWTKGGRERTIPIRTEAQQDVLNRARRLAGFGSLIPSNRNYVQRLRIYEGNTLRAGLSNMHGLRHTYAQNRYEELTGWKAPAAGGPKAKTLTPEQRETDRQTRLTISRELGHERVSITAAYCGV